MKKVIFLVIVLLATIFECAHTATNTANRIDTYTNIKGKGEYYYTFFEADDSKLVQIEDLANILSVTDSKFSVTKDNDNYIVNRNADYSGEGQKLTTDSVRPFYTISKININVDGNLKSTDMYNIDNCSYFKLTDLTEAIGINCQWIEKEAVYSFNNSDGREGAYMVMLPAAQANKTVTKRISEERIDPSKPMIALTFDDGPKPESTDRIVEALKKTNSRATFFVVGEMVEKHPELVKLAYDAGCQIGNHTYTHANLLKISADEVKTEIYKTSNLVYDITGEYTMVGRPPYGSINDNVRNCISIPWYNWSVDTNDWKNKDADYVRDYVLENVEDGDVVLMHDLHSTTADAMVRCIPELVDRGFQLVTMDELVKYRYNGDVTQVPGYVK